MCIDLFAPGYCLDVSFLLEQIWISPKQDLRSLEYKQIIDARIINRKGNAPLNCIWVLFPHNYITKEGGNYNISVHPIALTEGGIKENPEWNWAFNDKKTEWEEDEAYLIRPFDIEPPDVRLQIDPQHHSYYRGKILVPEIEYPEILSENNARDLLADIRKTLVCLKLEGDEGLEPGEAGWLRLVCTPKTVDSGELKHGIIPIFSSPLWFEQTLNMSCPMMVRDRLKMSLRRLQEEASPANKNEYYEIQKKIFNKIFQDKTSTRIADHRLAIIGEGIQDFEIYPSQGALFAGMINSLEKDGYSTYKWIAGANQNRKMDIMDNARRVIDMLRHIGEKSKIDIARNLSPSCLHESFSVFIDNMMTAKLIKPNQNGLFYTDIQKEEDFTQDPRIDKLRHIYQSHSHDESISNLLNLTDLHPFEINIKLKWFNINDKLISDLGTFFRRSEQHSSE